MEGGLAWHGSYAAATGRQKRKTASYPPSSSLPSTIGGPGEILQGFSSNLRAALPSGVSGDVTAGWERGGKGGKA